MKKLLVLALVGAVVAYCWTKYPGVRSSVERLVHKSGLFLLNMFREEKIEDPAVPPPPAPPEDVYYTRERITDGAYPNNRSIAMATQVRKKGEGSSGKLLVESEGKVLLADPSKLTRDPAEIAHLLRMTRVPARPAGGGQPAAIQAELDKLEGEIATTTAELRSKQSDEAKARARGAGVPMGTNLVFLQNRITRLEARRAVLRQQLEGTPYAPHAGSTPPPSAPANMPGSTASPPPPAQPTRPQ